MLLGNSKQSYGAGIHCVLAGRGGGRQGRGVQAKKGEKAGQAHMPFSPTCRFQQSALHPKVNMDPLNSLKRE